MENYKPNSHKSKEDAQVAKKIEPVVKNKATRKSNSSRNIRAMLLPNSPKDVGNKLLQDVLVPALLNTASDLVKNGIDMLLFGEVTRRTPGKKGDFIAYDRFANAGSSHAKHTAKNGYTYDDIVLQTREEADTILTQMCALIETYGHVCVADMYDLAGISGGDYTDNSYGWKNLGTASIGRTREGFILKLPKALPIN